MAWPAEASRSPGLREERDQAGVRLSARCGEEPSAKAPLAVASLCQPMDTAMAIARLDVVISARIPDGHYHRRLAQTAAQA